MRIIWHCKCEYMYVYPPRQLNSLCNRITIYAITILITSAMMRFHGALALAKIEFQICAYIEWPDRKDKSVQRAAS